VTSRLSGRTEEDQVKKLVIEAEKGGAELQFNVGVAIGNRADSDPVAAKRNRAESLKWLLKASRQGLPRAQIMLAGKLAEDVGGVGGVKACAWYLVALKTASGIHGARARAGYERISQCLSAAQIARAQHLSRIWKPKKQCAVPKPTAAASTGEEHCA
jgi:TPR repeat protein